MSEAVQELRILECMPDPLPFESEEADVQPSRNLFQRLYHWLVAKRQAQIASKRLRVTEQVSLGEKRFVAVVEVGRQHFLVGGSSTAVSLLAQLQPEQNFSQVLQQRRESNRR